MTNHENIIFPTDTIGKFKEILILSTLFLVDHTYYSKATNE